PPPRCLAGAHDFVVAAVRAACTAQVERALVVQSLPGGVSCLRACARPARRALSLSFRRRLQDRMAADGAERGRDRARLHHLWLRPGVDRQLASAWAEAR